MPFGLVGGRLYHVITDPSTTSATGGDPVEALYIWQGGLGIWGAIALGGVGAWIGCRRTGIPLPPLADALAPGIVLAQAIGRLGQLVQPGALRQAHRRCPGALEIDPAHRPAAAYAAVRDVPPDLPLRVGLGPRRRGAGDLGRPAVPARPRPGVRALRDGLHRRPRLDRVPPHRPVEANDVFGLRLNVWTSIVVFLLAAAYFVVAGRRHPGREESVLATGHEPPGEPDTADVTAVPADKAGDQGESPRRHPISGEDPQER